MTHKKLLKYFKVVLKGFGFFSKQYITVRIAVRIAPKPQNYKLFQLYL